MTLLETMLLSALPLSELRGGIPYALVQGMHPLAAYAAAVVANIAVVPLLFIFLDTLHKQCMKVSAYRRLFSYVLDRARKRAEKNVERWGYYGLILLVAIPLPVTGAYTGTLAAWFLELDRKKAVAAIAVGIMMAGLIVSAVVLTGATAWGLFVK